MSTRSVGWAVLAGGLVSAMFAACATGNQLTGVGGSGPGGSDPSGSTTGSGTKDAATPGMIGSPCKVSADCQVGECTQIGVASYCSIPCPPACPYASYCSVINGAPICVPDFYQECDKCIGSADCKLPSDACLQAPLGDKFCARDCSVDGVCPNGFVCEDSVTYEAPPVGDAGTDAGKDAGKDAGGDAGDAGDAGPVTYAPKWCVPNSGYSCPCNAQRDGVTHACSMTTPAGTCGGMETCDGKSSQWKGCTASTPVAETCNGKDDDCDGKIDNGDPNALCAASGPKPPHGSWACKDATCSLGACDPGWVSYPGGGASGCNCQLEAGEPNGTCAAATPAGMVTDVGGAPITLQGTLSSANDVDVWTFDAVDVDEATTNSYHVNLAFTAPMPNDEFVMDVMRGAPCSDAPTGTGTSITAYDWCVNGTDGATPPTGEASCGPTGVTHCGGLLNDSTSMSHTATYYVRVHRKPGATATCTTYVITATAQGGACDFTKKCP